MIRTRPLIFILILLVIILAGELIRTRSKLTRAPEQVMEAQVGQVGDQGSLLGNQTGRNQSDDGTGGNKEPSTTSGMPNFDPIDDVSDEPPAQFESPTKISVDDIGSSTSLKNPDPDILPLTESTRPESSEQNTGNHRPFMIRWSNWRPEFGPALVYAREWDIEGMLRLQGPLEKMLMVTSFAEAGRLMVRADELRTAGVTIVGFNTEEGPEMTPHEEMETLDIPDPGVNVVARVAQLANQHGFDVIWGPARLAADSVSNAAISTMLGAGMKGLALQEQMFIEVQPAQLRLAEVNRTRERYLRLAQEQSVDEFTFHVQIMPQRCPDLSNCADFVVGLEKIPVDSIAIWSNGPIPLGFISAIRHY